MGRHAFTLVELVVTVLLVGILASIAAPKLLNMSAIAKENGLRHSLTVVRDAIQRYAADNSGALPGLDKQSDTFTAELAPFLRSFPENPFDANGSKADEAKIRENGDPLVNHVGGNEGWLYDNTTGEFIANVNDVAHDGVTLLSEF